MAMPNAQNSSGQEPGTGGQSQGQESSQWSELEPRVGNSSRGLEKGRNQEQGRTQKSGKKAGSNVAARLSAVVQITSCASL